MSDERPGPRGHWLTGSMPEFRRDPLGFFGRCAREHGDVSFFRFFRLRCCLVADPELIRTVLVDRAESTIKVWDVQQLRVLLGRGLLTNEGASWRRQRRLIQPSFHNRRVRGYAPIVLRRARALSEGWREGQRLDLHAEMSRLTLEIVADALFGVDVDAEVPAIAAALDVFMGRFARMITGRIPVGLRIPTPGNLRARRAADRLRRITERLIARRRERGGEGDDLLGALLGAGAGDDGAGAEGGAMSPEQLRDEALTLLLAGHETTALALSWALWLLMRHPDVEERLAAEARAWRPEAPGAPASEPGRGEPGADPAAPLPFTRAVVQEALRLYPPAWGIGRETTREMELGGHRVGKGTQVFLVQWVTHRDPRFWPEPDAFHPERWLPEGRGGAAGAADGGSAGPAPDLRGSAEEAPQYAYFPFGGGPRFCVGSNFALLEATLALAAILRRWRFEPLSEPPVEPLPAVTLRPRQGVPALARRR